MRTAQVEQLLRVSIPHGLSALLVGQPGVGKTSIIKQLAEELKYELIIMHPAVSDPTDYKGLPFATPDGKAKFLPFDDLNRLIETDKPTIAFLDDLGQAPASVQAACMQLILERRINGHMISDKVMFTAATNRASDRAGVTPILEPVKSRFVNIIDVDIHVDDWIKWALKEDLPIEVIAFVKYCPSALTDWKPEREIKQQPSPRTIEFMARMFATGQVPPAIEFDTYKSIVGEGIAGQFVGFIKVMRELPDPDQCIMSPDTAPVPKSPDAAYALAVTLTRKANANNLGNILKYTSRLQKEYDVLFIKFAIEQNKALANTKAYIKWASENHEEVFGNE